MKKWCILFLLTLTGCEPPIQPVVTQNAMVSQNAPISLDKGQLSPLETFSLRENDPRHTMLVLKYGGKRHVFLVHTTMYRQYADQTGGPIACSESMVKVGEYPLED